MNKKENLSKHVLQPFTAVLTKNYEVGVVIRFNDAEIICFRKCIIFLNAYNDDLTLKDRVSLLNLTEDENIVQYYDDLLNIDDYYNYEILEKYEIDNFNLLNKMIQFNALEKQLLELTK